MIGILFMLFGPTSTGFARVRSTPAYSGPAVGFNFTPPPPPPPPYPAAFLAEGSAPIAPAPGKYGLSTDFSSEEPVREMRIRAPSPPPLPAVTPLPTLPKAAQTIAPPPLPKAAAKAPIAPAVRAEATPTTPPRLGVSAPSARARHLQPPRRMPPPMPRSRSARGSDAPPPSFATENQHTVPRARELDEFSTAEHTFVD